MIAASDLPFDWLVAISLLFLLLAIALVMVRLIWGPTPADRVVALDLLTMLLVGLIALIAVQLDQPVLIDLAIVFALLGFLSTVAFARYLELLSDKRRRP